MDSKTTKSKCNDAIGFDNYNFTPTWQISNTHIATDSGTRRSPYVFVRINANELAKQKKTQVAIGFDVYNFQVTGVVSKTLNSIRSDSDHVPVVFACAATRNSNELPKDNRTADGE